MTFEEKVRSMTSYEIIMAMVNGLKNPVTEIDMDTFGCIVNNICYGCAATNTIANICSITSFEDISTKGRVQVANSGYAFLSEFELAIDELRNGAIDNYNDLAKRMRVAEIKLPIDNEALFTHWFFEGCLENENYLEKLPVYEWLAQLQLYV